VCFSPSCVEPSDAGLLVSGAEFSEGAGGASLGSSGLESTTAGSGDMAFCGSLTENKMLFFFSSHGS